MPKRRRLPERAKLAARSCSHELSSGAQEAELRRALDWLDAGCRHNGVPPAQADRLVLCLNEVLANIVAHGKPTQPIVVRLEVSPNGGDGEATVTVSDACQPFDPLSVPQKAKPVSLEEASTSGMGLAILRHCAEVLEYRHEGGRNHLTFGSRWRAR